MRRKKTDPTKPPLATRLLALADGGAVKSRIAGTKNVRPSRVLPTGYLSLDWALHCGGWPEARITIIHGGESSGKTTLCLKACAQVQARGGIAIYFDNECKLDEAYAMALGVDMDSLIQVNAEHVEAAFEHIEGMIDAIRKEDADLPVLIVYDSIHSLQSKRSSEADYSGVGYSPESLAYSQSLRKLNPRIKESRTIVLAVSQVRTDVTGMGYGKNEKIAIGKAWGHYASLIVTVDRRAPKLGQLDNEAPEGQGAKIRVTKNQVGKPYRQVLLSLKYGVGFDEVESMFEAALYSGVIEQSASWYTLDVGVGEPIKVQGRDRLMEHLASPEIAAAVEARVREGFGEEVFAFGGDGDDEGASDA